MVMVDIFEFLVVRNAILPASVKANFDCKVYPKAGITENTGLVVTVSFLFLFFFAKQGAD